MWRLLACGLFIAVPVIGPIVVAGHLAVIIAYGIETAIVVGGLSAFGAALRYEKAVKEDRFLVIVHGASSDGERARAILKNSQSLELDVHEHVSMTAAPVAAGLT